jgi:hypothetical protein
MTTISVSRTSGDRISELAVIVVVAVALLAGWGLKSSVESQAITFSEDGVTAQVPAGWLRATPGRGEVLRVSNPAASGFATTYVIEAEPVAQDATLAGIVGPLSLKRAQQWMAYRVLDQQPVTVDGRDAYRVLYVYVESDPDVTHAQLPSVVRGEDYVFLNAGRAIIVSYRAESDVYDLDHQRFEQFLTSVTY